MLVTWSVRRWRRADHAAAEAAAARVSAGPRPPAELSPDGERELARVVTVLADAGVFAPQAPDPADLRRPVADHGEPVTLDGVLAALDEGECYSPGFDAEAYSANLAFHPSRSEQFASVVQGHVDDLVRLAGGGLTDVSSVIELDERAGTARVHTRVRLSVDGAERVLAYDGAVKDVCTVVHVALARILHERRTGRRLAWFWGDQGVWLTALPDGTLDDLNAALGAAAMAGWEWVDEDAPTTADDLYVF